MPSNVLILTSALLAAIHVGIMSSCSLPHSRLASPCCIYDASASRYLKLVNVLDYL